MHHLAEERIYAHLFDNQDFTAMEVEHLQGCESCQRQLAAAEQLASTMAVVRRSQPSQTQMERYAQIIQHVEQPATGLSQWVQLLQLGLSLDSRHRPALQGLRSGSSRNYRLLYSAVAADVELLVETSGHTRRIEGEVLPLDDEQLIMPVLVEFLPAEQRAERSPWMVESNKQGRFHLDGVTLGYYNLVITPCKGPFLQIKGIDIT